MDKQLESEFVLALNEFVYISDQTKGDVFVHVGPCKITVAGTDQPMIYDPESESYKRRDTIASAVQKFPFADERSYVVLENPSEIEDDPYPKRGTKNGVPPIHFGRCINVQGPVTFALWPGQTAKVLDGHQLRSNQYLVARILNADEAQKNWDDAVISKAEPIEEPDAKDEKAKGAEGGDGSAKDKDKDKDKNKQTKIENGGPKLLTGQRLIIKGTDISFYIPPTGVEIIPDEHGNYIRNAVTLEHLQYCILHNENGVQRVVEGPAVVFPEPTESFLKRKNESGMKAFKFRALELNDFMGIHIKQIDNDKGEELFITGKQQKIYVPKPEHSIIKHGDDIIHYAVAIPKGEARYKLNKLTGAVSLEKGPRMYLPDPRKEQVIRRKLDRKIVELWFPGNQEAIDYNETLEENTADFESFQAESARGIGYPDRTLGSSTRALYSSERQSMEQLSFGDEVVKSKRRRQKVMTLDTKYDGAVTISIWSGYAIQVISKTGDRKVHIGPKTVMLEYDEVLEIINLSRGTPKTDKNKKRTVYLRVLNNRISDVVEAETKDLVNVKILLSYRVNFEGDSKKWFSVEDYVGFLTDHLRSMIRNAVKQHGIEDFNDKAINIIRDTVLGESKSGKRAGRSFDENNMRVYDVEVLNVNIGDEQIEQLLIENQHDAVETNLEIREKERELEKTKKTEDFNQRMNKARSTTVKKQLELEKEEESKRHSIAEEKLSNELKLQKDTDKVHESELLRKKKTTDQDIAQEKERLEMTTDAFVEKFKAIEPDMVAALTTIGQMGLAQEFVKNLPQSPGGLNNLFGGGGLEQLKKLVKGTVVEKGLNQLLTEPVEAEIKGNGGSNNIE